MTKSTITPIDPITLSTVWHSFQSLCREMRHVIERTAQSYLMAYLKDVSVGVWLADGSCVAMPEGLPSQFLGNKFAIQAVLEKFRGNLHPGVDRKRGDTDGLAYERGQQQSLRVDSRSKRSAEGARERADRSIGAQHACRDRGGNAEIAHVRESPAAGCQDAQQGCRHRHRDDPELRCADRIPESPVLARAVNALWT